MNKTFSVRFGFTVVALTLAAVWPAGCVDGCNEAELVHVEVAGQRYTFTADTPVAYFGKSEGEGTAVAIDYTSRDGRIRYCSPTDKINPADRIAFDRDRIDAWPSGFELFDDISQFALQRSPSRPLPIPLQPASITSVGGWLIHDHGKTYELTAQGLPGWPHQVLARCHKSDSQDFLDGRCRVTSQFGDLRIVMDADMKQAPLESWPTYLRAIDAFFQTFRSH